MSHEEDVFRTKSTTPDFGLFAAPVVTMPGAGQAARSEAREAVDTSEGRQRCIHALEGSGGLTRTEIAAVTGMPVNSVNARIAELRDAARWGGLPQVVTQGRRGSESVCHMRDQVP